MSPERQRGLVAECLFLRQLIQSAVASGLGAQAALDRWWGPAGGKRDFAASGISIEVKSTAANTRNHHIASLEQLDPLAPDGSAYLLSVGLRSDPQSERKLTTYLADVSAQIVLSTGEPDTVALYEFQARLASAGYDSAFEASYRSAPGIVPNPLLPPRLFRVSDLERLQLSSFKNETLPSTVTAIAYDLDVVGEALTENDAAGVVHDLLRAQAL
jgi:hypothetical protein